MIGLDATVQCCILPHCPSLLSVCTVCVCISGIVFKNPIAFLFFLDNIFHLDVHYVCMLVKRFEPKGRRFTNCPLLLLLAATLFCKGLCCRQIVLTVIIFWGKRICTCCFMAICSGKRTCACVCCFMERILRPFIFYIYWNTNKKLTRIHFFWICTCVVLTNTLTAIYFYHPQPHTVKNL